MTLKIKIKGKNKLRIVLHKGTLTQHGYSSKDKSTTRRKSLTKAVIMMSIEKGESTHTSALRVFRKLNVLATLNKNKNPKLSKIFKSDAEWVKKKLF